MTYIYDNSHIQVSDNYQFNCMTYIMKKKHKICEKNLFVVVIQLASKNSTKGFH